MENKYKITNDFYENIKYMIVKEIRFLTPNAFEEIADIENDNLDVFVEFEDGYICTVVVGTAKNLEWLMEKEKKNFLAQAIHL